MVGVRRFELLTSSVSGKRSPPELNARISAAGVAARSILRENAHVTQPSIASFSRITNTAQRAGRWRGMGSPARTANAVTVTRREGRRLQDGCNSAHQNDREVFSATFSQETGSDRSFWRALLGEGTPPQPRGTLRGGAMTGRTPATPPSQTCGLIAVRREGPRRLPAVLLGYVVARVLLTRRFPEEGLPARTAQDGKSPSGVKTAPERPLWT